MMSSLLSVSIGKYSKAPNRPAPLSPSVCVIQWCHFNDVLDSSKSRLSSLVIMLVMYGCNMGCKLLVYNSIIPLFARRVGSSTSSVNTTHQGIIYVE